MEQHRAHLRHGVDDASLMGRAIDVAHTARLRARPNPWVGAVLVCADGREFEGATSVPGGPHAEIVAMNAARAAGAELSGAVLFTTLEPCSHHGRTGPCADAVISAGIARVVIGVEDPDTKVAGRGIARLRDAGIDVTVGVRAADVNGQLAPYLHHRSTGRPWVVLKMATTLDGRTVAPHGERWITGSEARARVHELRAESDAILVGSGTVRADDPELTVRHVDGPSPRRIVLSRAGGIDTSARVHPCEVWTGGLAELLDSLGAGGVIQLLVEGGPTVAGAFHSAGLVNRYVFHVAPVISGEPDAPGVFGLSPSAHDHTLSANRLVSAGVLGNDIELVLEPHKETAA